LNHNLTPFLHGVNLLLPAFYLFSAHSATFVLKKLRLSAPLALAANHEQSPAVAALFTSGKGLPSAERADYGKRPAAPGANGIAALYFLEAFRAMKTEGTAAFAP